MKPVTLVLEELVLAECNRVPMDALVADFGCSMKTYATAGRHLVRFDKRPEVKPTVCLDFNNEFLPYKDDSFSLGLSFNVINYVEDKAFFLGEVYRTLKPGATLVISSMNRWGFLPVDLKRHLRAAGFTGICSVNPLRSLFGGTCIVKCAKPPATESL